MTDATDSPNLKRIAFVNYHGDIFWDFTEQLRHDGFEVFWINTRPLSSAKLRERGIPAENICDVLVTTSDTANTADPVEVLRNLEQDGLPTINSIILMDQNLRHAPYDVVLRYLAHAALRIQRFLSDNRIQAVSSGRDTALQILSLLVCRRLGIWWGCVTRTKLPKDRFGFSPSHQGDRFINIREPTSDDRQEARLWLDGFRSGKAMKPYARPRIKGFSIFLKEAILHASVLLTHARHRLSHGSDPRVPGSSSLLHIQRCIREFLNYLYVRFFLRFDRLDSKPFVLYGLHRQPESSIDVRGAYFDDQFALIRQIARSLPVTHALCIKVHFSDVAGQSREFYRRLRMIPGVKLLDSDLDSRSLIEKASVIVTNVGAMGQEGGYLGRPVISMSRMFWDALPTVTPCGAPADLPSLVRHMIDQPPADDPEKITDILAGFFADSFPCDPNLAFMNKSFSANELTALSNAYQKIMTLASRPPQPSAVADR